MAFCRRNYIVCKFVMANVCDYELATKIRSELKKTIPNSRTLYDENDPRFYLTTFAISAFLFAILEWMDDGMRIAPAAMAEFLTETYLSGAIFIKKSKKNYAAAL